MQENRNASAAAAQGTNGLCNGTVCIDTRRVLDSCRDRDCFEDTRVYLTARGEEILAASTNVRTREARILFANIVVEEVPFNCGFFRIIIRYYVEVEFECCLGVGRSQTFKGLCALEKEVVLYGGEGRAISFTSTPRSDFCDVFNHKNATTNDPIAVVETVEPVVLGTRVSDCNCPCPCGGTEYTDLPEGIRDCLGDELVTNTTGPRLLVSFGLFSVIRIERTAQLLVQATDYSVPDKECTDATNNDNPCALFRTIAFPTNQFKVTNCLPTTQPPRTGGCGCSGRRE